MSYLDERGGVLVSLQDRALADDALGGHLALGGLIGPDRALFPLPAGLELTDDARLEVLVVPTAAGEKDLVEHLRPTAVLVRSLDSAADQRIALITLAHGSRYAALPAAVSVDEVTDALRRTGDIWGAAVALGLVPDLSGLDPTPVLGRVAEIETLHRRSLVSTLLGRTADETGKCPFSPISPCGQGPFL